jgi:malate permease and related proteins
MMIIGMGLVGVGLKNFDISFIGATFFAKFVVWPITIFLIVLLDRYVGHIFDASVHQVLMLMSIVPLAANTVAIATELRTHPEKAAIAVLLSTIFALFFIPLVVSLL